MRHQWKIASALILSALSFGVANAQQRAPDSLPGCQYNATPPTLGDKQTVAWQCDINGKLITSGGGGLGTVTSIATTSPITGGTITTTGTIACATCVTSAAALTANSLMIGSGSQASAVTTTGTGVLTALGVNVGSAGALVTNGGALGTPSSGTATNLTGTATGLTAGNVAGTGVGSLGSLATGGCTIGGNALCATGTANINGALTLGAAGSIISATSLQFTIGGVNKLDYNVTASNAWTIVGALNATGGVLSTGVTLTGTNSSFQMPNAGAIYWASRSFVTSPADGVVSVQINAGTNGFQLTANATSGLMQVGTATGSANALGSVQAATVVLSSTVKVGGFTVATLPVAGTAGRMAYVTDQLTACAVAGAGLTGGGAVVCPVFDNGVAWVGN